jgi:hypothetical protein
VGREDHGYCGGLSVVLAVVPGDPFRLGQVDSIDAVSHLVGSVTRPMLKIDNNGLGYALQLLVEPNRLPLVVNADSGKALNLNADELDGKDSAAYFTGATYRKERSNLNPAGGTAQSYVQCDGPEDRALGGGYRDVAPGTTVTASRPYVAPEAVIEGWEVRWQNETVGDEVFLEVVCADSPPMHTPQPNKTTSVAGPEIVHLKDARRPRMRVKFRG